MKKGAALLLGLGLAVLAACGQSGHRYAPTFVVRDLDGRTVASADLRGKVVVVNFWATWCPPCRAEIPDFVAFYEEFKSRGLEIVGFSLDSLTGGPATADQLRPFVVTNSMTYPVVVAPEKVIRDFDPGDSIPTTFILDKTGRIRHKQVGAMDKDALVEWFGRLSAEK